jgi:hypothetical protein
MAVHHRHRASWHTPRRRASSKSIAAVVVATVIGVQAAGSAVDHSYGAGLLLLVLAPCASLAATSAGGSSAVVNGVVGQAHRYTQAQARARVPDTVYPCLNFTGLYSGFSVTQVRE